MLYKLAQTLYRFLGGHEVPGTADLLWCERPGSLTGQTFHGETHPHRRRGGLIRRQSDHDDYTCSCGGAAMSDGDEMRSSTQVPGARCAWVHVAMSYRVSL
jgi:hypothetical protein